MAGSAVRQACASGSTPLAAALRHPCASFAWVFATPTALTLTALTQARLSASSACSTLQRYEQPSPLVALPSSQPSPVVTMPLLHPVIVQFASQPSPLTRLVSSHASQPIVRVPSPQVGARA